ncbi:MULTISPECIES: glycosyltransferase [Sphingobacterium]|jgi:glycosyltransferase involved in cell wall biosynthesis|uniref:glycosyltransferase n=1 Tax=Sphingobacterium TaxID=28453 RepID=UPI00257EB192|nr:MULTISPECIES: glycosyltransferase [Sphingobacterium]
MRVSIIVPTYNRESTIKQCIESIIDQNYNYELEIIISDDGSTDNTIIIVKEFGDKVTLIQKPVECTDQGASYARNRGLSVATGTLIGFLDSDDYYLPGYLNIVVKEFNDLEIGYTFARAKKEVLNPDGSMTLIPWTREKMNRLDVQYHVLFRAYNINTNVIIFRKSILDSVGLFDTSLSNGEDSDMWIRISEISKGKFVDYYGAVYRIDHSDNQLSKNVETVKRKCANILYASAFARTLSSSSKDKLRLLIIIRNIMLINIQHKSFVKRIISKFSVHFKLMMLYPISFVKFCIYGIIRK